MNTLPRLLVLQCYFLLANGLLGEELKWEDVSARAPSIEKLRTNLPTPKPPLRIGSIVSMDGLTLPMPNGKRAFYSQLDQIAIALVPKDQEGVSTLLSYLRDRDPHIRVLAYWALELHLANHGLGKEDFFAGVVAPYLQEPRASKAIEDVVRRVSKLPRLEEGPSPAKKPEKQKTEQGQRKPKQLQGHVVATDPAWEFAVVNLGSVHGVLENTEFIVSRRGEQIARLRAEQVENVQTIATMDPKTEIPIKPGDRAVAVGNDVPRSGLATKPIIRAIYPGLRFVVIEGGSSNGIEKGDSAEVVRDGQVIAKLVVTTVESNTSAADIIPSSLEDRTLLRNGDMVRPEGAKRWRFKAEAH